MDSRPFRHANRIAIFLLLLCAALHAGIPQVHAATSDTDALNGLRALGVQMKQVLDNISAGTPPDQNTLDGFDRAFWRSSADATSTGSTLEHKRSALQRLRRQLNTAMHQPLSGSTSPRLTTGAISRDVAVRRDIETVVPTHGDTCANALGISTRLPVEMVLAQQGHGTSDAWLYFEAVKAGQVRFSTDSSGADPALEVFSDCSASSKAMAANDDAFGLDAAATAATTAGKSLFVHLTNSGAGGRVTVQATDATTSIGGTVRDAVSGAPLVGAQIDLYVQGINSFAGYAVTDQQGSYVIPVAAGSYFVTVVDETYLAQIYPGVNCPPTFYNPNLSCPFGQALAVAVPANGTATADFLLSHGLSISGQVRDASEAVFSGQYLTYVTLADTNGVDVADASVDSFGRYSVTQLTAGTYRLRASASGYGAQMFDHKACAGHLQQTCDLSLATDVVLVDKDLMGFNFELPLLPSIVGTVTPAQTGVYPANATITMLDGSGHFVGQGSVDLNGDYVIGPVDPGSYYVSSSIGGYFPQLYSAVDCGADCATSLAGGTAVVVTATNPHPRADFHLHPVPLLKGHIQDADTHLPLANVTVDFGTRAPGDSFQSYATAVSDSNGDFSEQIGPGNFYVWARSNDHIDQIYPDIACESSVDINYFTYLLSPCTATSSALVKILPGVTLPALNFSLVASSSIRGSMSLRAGPGSDLVTTGAVDIYNSAGVEQASAAVDTHGNYVIGDLPAATYFALAQNSYTTGFVDQLWQQSDCYSNCVPTSGKPIVLGRATAVAGIDFSIFRTNLLFGRVTNTHGNPVAGVLVDLFGADRSYLTTGVSDALGYYSVGNNSYGTFYLATETDTDYMNQVYPAIACPAGSAYYNLCSLTGAAPISLGSANTQPPIANFVLQVADDIFHGGFE